MTYQIIATARVGGGPQVYLAASGDQAYVAPGVLVASQDDFSLLAQGSSNAVTVDGTVAGGGDAAIRLGDNPVFDSNQWVFVGQAGIVRAPTTAISICGHDSLVINHGQIGGGAVGVSLSGQGMGMSRLINHGVISADTGVRRSTTVDSEAVSLTNFGTLEGQIWAYDGLLGSVVDTITNRGLIVGNVRLGGGDDRYDGRGAGEVVGKVSGGDGNDVFLLGMSEELIDGGAGIDTIDATASGAITLALDGSVAGVGRTEGDTLISIEVVLGARLAGDRLYGTTGAQTLSGQGGADWLEGRSGDDTLLGGEGADRLVGEAGRDALTGGPGDDRFVFGLVTDAGDIITDFSAHAGNNDAVEISVAGFAAGLTRGVLADARFQVRTDNRAQDADDRFIFNTTDHTLWFDSNGNATGGVVMLADLQAGAVLTAADILLV